MPPINLLSPLQKDVLSPLTGKIATGFKYEQSPNHQLFSDKLSIRLRSLDALDSEIFLGIHYKKLAPHVQVSPEPILNISINLLATEEIEIDEDILGFERAEHLVLKGFLRQPLNDFTLVTAQSLLLNFSRQALIFDCDLDEENGLHLGWAIH